MPSLNELPVHHSSGDADFQGFCASQNIFTVEDFLLHDLDKLSATAQQLKYADRLVKGLRAVTETISEMHQRWSNGADLVQNARENKDVFSTGYDRLDSLLCGGLREGHLTELAGPSSSGKTQICLKAAANVAAHNGTVVYVDTGNSFSPRRVEQFVSSILQSAQVTNSVTEEVMRSILHFSVFDIFSLFDLLHRVERNLKTRRVRLLVIDSISSLIKSILSGNNPQGHSLMVSMGFLLKKMADEYNVAVLVTNHMVGGEGGTSKAALGESWKSVPHVRILILRDHVIGGSKLCVAKHPSAVSFGLVTFAAKFGAVDVIS